MRRMRTSNHGNTYGNNNNNNSNNSSDMANGTTKDVEDNGYLGGSLAVRQRLGSFAMVQERLAASGHKHDVSIAYYLYLLSWTYRSITRAHWQK
jgi:two-component sensor histidine kinase